MQIEVCPEMDAKEALFMRSAESASIGENAGGPSNGLHPYVRLARRTVARLLEGASLPESGLAIDGRPELWAMKRACFVSIKTLRGDLRGCIGTILPTQPDLGLEIIANAVSASTRDPRFPPMTAPELGGVKFSVDVLTPPEPASRDRLDPKTWGVIVTQGWKRGVLLPDLEGVDSVELQLSIAAQKAGIQDFRADGVHIERFRVERCREE
jgi:AmmeMemoRadiSam system protein A